MISKELQDYNIDLVTLSEVRFAESGTRIIKYVSRLFHMATFMDGIHMKL